MKTVQNVKNSLKFKATEKEGVLTVRVGVKKYVLPVAARVLSNEGYLFLSFPASSELYRIKGKGLEAMDKDDDAAEAYAQLNTTKRARGRRGGSMPNDLAEALSKIPAGYKIGYGADGTPRLVKMRVRRKK